MPLAAREVSFSVASTLMKVLLVANYEPDAQQSMLRYAEFLRQGLEQRGHQMEIVHPPAVVGRLVSRGNPLWKWLGYIDKFVLFPARLKIRARNADLVHVCDHSNSCYLRWTGKTPRVITAHDLLAVRSALGHFPQTRTGLTGRWLQRWILNGLASAQHIISVSGKTKQDLEALLTSKPDIRVIHHSLNWRYEPATSAEIEAVRASCGLNPDDEYLLHVGANQWYKNRLGVLKIMLELRKYERFRKVKLVMAGKPWTEAMRAFCREHALGDVIEFVSPSNQQLRALYSSALAFLFPSIEEGFGWPVLEAQACGCLVITSDRPPMTEIAGQGAILIDPEDAVTAAKTIDARISEADAIKLAGWENLKRFVMDDVMKRYDDAYESVLADSRAQ
jgi:glycosyltransferase involved in cell wall biosynthesis